MGIRDSRTTHPRKSARRERALERLERHIVEDSATAAHIDVLRSRIGKPPRAWPFRLIQP
ncbi:hypothetical protein [Roseateles sp.]|uniref:hypothetical protein n=1 Tax=Roseateles sp. TaxID=1971397 RepID=UPI0031DE9AD4